MPNFESQPTVPDPKRAVLDEIGSIRQEVGLMGANDREIPELDRIAAELREGGVDPQKALEAAREILASKQDYH